jgi:hypothetical protein
VRKYVHVTTMYVPRARRFERPMCPYLSVFVRCARCARIVRPSVARVCERAPVRDEKNLAPASRKPEPKTRGRPAPKPRHKLTDTNQEPSRKGRSMIAEGAALHLEKIEERAAKELRIDLKPSRHHEKKVFLNDRNCRSYALR